MSAVERATRGRPWRTHPPALADCTTDAERLAWHVTFWHWEALGRWVVGRIWPEEQGAE